MHRERQLPALRLRQRGVGVRPLHHLERPLDVYAHVLPSSVTHSHRVLFVVDLMSNLILGAVVENFSYVFQNYGKVKSLNREQMRNFKKVWRQFDPERTGYIQKKDIVPFFAVHHVLLFPDFVRR